MVALIAANLVKFCLLMIFASSLDPDLARSGSKPLYTESVSEIIFEKVKLILKNICR